jgi:glutaredoxin
MNALLIVCLALQAPSKDQHPAPAAGGFFKTSEVDFWGEKAASAKKKAAEEKPEKESIWAEPIKSPDGRTQVYLPPKAVLQFLEAPSRETAKEYVAWQEERMKRLKAAMVILRELQEERASASESAIAAVPATKEAAPAAAPLPVEILYFKRAGCPWCAKEDQVLGPLMRKNPELKVKVVSIEEAPDLAQANGVTVVPTLLLQGKNGKALALRGFMTEEQIQSALQEVNRAEK